MCFQFGAPRYLNPALILTTHFSIKTPQGWQSNLIANCFARKAVPCQRRSTDQQLTSTSVEVTMTWCKRLKQDQSKCADCSNKHTLAQEAAITSAKNRLTPIIRRLTSEQPIEWVTQPPKRYNKEFLSIRGHLERHYAGSVPRSNAQRWPSGSLMFLVDWSDSLFWMMFVLQRFFKISVWN